ncbi:MAG: 3D domain-containing protein [Erysipelotrichaceae bacterium]
MFGIIYDHPEIFKTQKMNDRLKEVFFIDNSIRVVESFKTVYPNYEIHQKEKLESGDLYFMTSFSHLGDRGNVINEYQINYDIFGRITSKELVKSSRNDATPSVYYVGAPVEIGAYFYPHFSRYGVDCVGCSGEKTGQGAFSVGVKANLASGVQQYNGNYKPGITFEDYYIVAADPAFPLCTILKIEDHNYQGAGLTPKVPFYAVVLDRGSAIKNNRLDFYIGTQVNYNSLVSLAGKNTPKATVVAFGQRQTVDGRRTCKLPKINNLEG